MLNFRLWLISLLNVTKEDIGVIDESKPRYAIHGLQGLDMKLIADLPYSIEREMKWDKVLSWELDEDEVYPRYLIYVIRDDLKRQWTEVYVTKSKKTFAWTFKEARGKDNQPHPNAGAYWIDDKLDWFSNE